MSDGPGSAPRMPTPTRRTPFSEHYVDYQAELEAMDREIGEIARAPDLFSVVSGTGTWSQKGTP